MERCLYTYVELNENDPPNSQTATMEHIVPYALGGCDAFSISYCSKKANNDFGSDIDARFISLPIVGFKRHALGLKGQSGRVPDIVFDGECMELQRRCSIIFPHGDLVYADFKPDVKGSIAAGQMSFAGSEDRLRGAVESLIRKAKLKGHKVFGQLGQQLEPITNFDEAIEASTKSTGETLHFRINFGWDNFVVPWTRGIIKIALGLGAYALGRSWAFSADADKLRSCLLRDTAPSEDFGMMAGRFSSEIARLLDIRPQRHTLAVLPLEKEMVACVSLFGGEVFDAIIRLGAGPADVKLVNDTLPTTWKCVFHIDPTTRSLTTRTLSDINGAFGGTC